ncbi:MAG: MarR family transcriptional regulator [Clostridia bacterium]|nr:MarR family transcriptional regulator [Clostridia bacterium]
MKKYDALLLKNQLCFPLYATSREVIKKYRPHLDKIGLTYTQYLTMMVLWEADEINVTELGKRLFLDSGTLTPVLKSLEQKGFITRCRLLKDERVLIVRITEQGKALRDEAVSIPCELRNNVKLTEEEAKTLYTLLYKLLDN